MDKDKVFIYDIESYPNFFSIAYYLTGKGKYGYIEISTRENSFSKMISILHTLQKQNYIMCGFNNYEYDWTIVDWVWNNVDELKNLPGGEIAYKINEFNNYWFNTLQRNLELMFEYRKDNKLWPNSLKIPQLDLYKIHRLDAVKIGLKTIQFNMRFPSIRTLPYPPNTILDHQQMDEIKDYNISNDVAGTKMFYEKSSAQIGFRVDMQELLNKSFMTSSDVKIAEEWFKKELEEPSELLLLFNGYEPCEEGFKKIHHNGFESIISLTPIQTYYYQDEERFVNQTSYPNGFYLDKNIFDVIELKTPAFKAFHSWIKKQHIVDTEGVFRNLPKEQVEELLPYANPTCLTKEGGMKKIELLYGGIPFVFGLGGLHASIESQYVKSCDTYTIRDYDFRSWYPNIIAGVWKVLGEKFRIFPAHIGELFCEITKFVYEKRAVTPKSDARNLMYKLIMNAFSFGKLNEPSSFVYDPKACMSVTINGQLLLCMLTEWIYENTTDTHIIQANTDGVTFKVNRGELDIVQAKCNEFSKLINIVLEEAIYDFMAINNVNHYIAKYSMDIINEKPGSMKAKGQYLTNPSWTQDFSTLVIQKAVIEYFSKGTLPEDFINNHTNPYDFAARINIDKRFKLIGLRDDNHDLSFKKYSIKDKKKYDTFEKIKNLEDKISISDRLMFQRIIRNKDKDIVEEINKINNQDDFIIYIKQKKALDKSIDFNDVDDKVVNRALKSIPSRAVFIGERLAQVYNVEERVAKSFARWYLDMDKKLDMKPIKVKQLSKVTAYYIAKNGFNMYKETLPTVDNPSYGRFTAVPAGYTVMDCNDMSTFNIDNINRQWYIDEAWKLINPIKPKG